MFGPCLLDIIDSNAKEKVVRYLGNELFSYLAGDSTNFRSNDEILLFSNQENVIFLLLINYDISKCKVY